MLAPGCDGTEASRVSGETEVLPIDDRGLIAAVHAGDRPYVLLSFFTTFCKPCVKEIPDLYAMHQDPESPVQVLFVSLDHGSSRAHLPAFMQKVGLERTYFLDEQAAATFFGENLPDWNQSVPQNLLFSRDGRLVEHMQMTGSKEVIMLIHKDQSFH